MHSIASVDLNSLFTFGKHAQPTTNLSLLCHSCKLGVRIGRMKSNFDQVSFGNHETEEKAARQYDRALIIEKGRAAKTNFPLTDYDQEVADFDALLQKQ